VQKRAAIMSPKTFTCSKPLYQLHQMMQRDPKASRAIYEPHFWYSSPPVTFSATRYEEVAANYLALIQLDRMRI